MSVSTEINWKPHVVRRKEIPEPRRGAALSRGIGEAVVQSIKLEKQLTRVFFPQMILF